MFCEDRVESDQTNVDRRRDEAEIHHADMLTTMPDDEITTVAILRDQDAIFTDAGGENLGILEVDRVVPADPCHVVAESPKVRDDGDVGARIDDEPHDRAVAPTSTSCLRCLCFRSRALRA